MRPRITFDADGVCSACRFAERRETTDWNEREEELKRLCDFYRKNDGSFDVIVPVSGGKDGGFVAHQLKHKYGMHPLCVTWAPLLPTDIGRQNLDAFVASGFDLIQGRPNGQVARKLARLAFEHMGDIFQPFILGQTNFPLQIAVKYQIPLIFYGEDAELIYGGEVKKERATRNVGDHERQYFSGRGPDSWTAYGLSAKDLHHFAAPKNLAVDGLALQIHFFSYYVDWVPQNNFFYCSEHTGFTPNPERTTGTYSKFASLDDELDFLHYYAAFLKFGIGRATSDSAHEIREGIITREEGVALVKKFDGEFSDHYWKIALDYMGMTDAEGRAILEKWRNPEMFDGNEPRYAVWK